MKASLRLQLFLVATAVTTLQSAEGARTNGGEKPPVALTHDICQADAQCLHGGHCVRTREPGAVFHNPAAGEFNYCLCADGFGGQRCESYCPLQCQNGGICYSKGGGGTSSSKPEEATADPEHPLSSTYACKCLGRWTGTVCDVAYENCGNGLQCFNRGTCVLTEGEQEDDYECSCPSGYGGPSCRDESLVTEATPPRDALLGISKTGVALLLLAMVVLPGLALILLRRRKQRHRAYDTVFHNDSDADFQYEFSVSEKWRNVV